MLLVALLRRAVPLPFLELLASTPPWSEDQRLLAAVVLSPRATRPLGLRLVGSLQWRDLADVAASPRVAAAVKVRAEAMLKDQLLELRLGEKITLAKMATPPVLMLLLADKDEKVVEAGAHQRAPARGGPADAGAGGPSEPRAPRRDRRLLALGRALRAPPRHRAAAARAGRARARPAQRADHEGSRARRGGARPHTDRPAGGRSRRRRPLRGRASRPEKLPNPGSSGG